MVNALTCDVAIIGAGTAGLAAERNARRAGASTLLIDGLFAGTTCASVGCMPSKLMIAAARAAHEVRHASEFGIRVATPTIDGAAVMLRVRSLRDGFVKGMLDAFAKLPEGIAVKSWARFIDQSTLLLDDGRRVSAKAIVIATGSRPHVAEKFAVLGDLVLTNETIFELSDLPTSVAVIGAGPLGLELGQALARLGVTVAVFGRGQTIAGLRDEVVAESLKTILSAELALHLGVDPEVRRDGDAAVLSWHGGPAGGQRFERVLVAAGRRPQLDTLDLYRTGIRLDARGTPLFDRTTMQCGDAPLFIAGDADATTNVVHEASFEGALAGTNAASFPQVHKAHRNVALSIMFTDPPVAVIGEPATVDSVIGCAPYDDQGRAKVEARNVGVARLYAAKPDGCLTGAAMVGPGMDHMAHLIAWSVERGQTATELLDLPFYHPTLEEGLKSALREICHTVHAPIPTNRDEGRAPGG